MSAEDKPAFEVRADGRVFKIWADGHVTGFGGAAIIINRIPVLLNQAIAKARAGEWRVG